MEKKQVWGLLGAMETEAKGEQWECSSAALGLGASDRARRLVELGRLAELVLLLPQDRDKKSRGRGRPRKRILSTNDVKRALLLYCVARDLRSEQGLPNETKVEIPLFKLIAHAEERFPTYGIFQKPAAPNKMYESVKAGREKLGVDKFWRGPPLESLFNLN